VRRGWLYVTIIATVLSALAIGALVTLNVVMWSKDQPGIIDDPDVIDAMDTECSLMTFTVDSIAVYGSADDQVDALADQDAAVLSMVDNLRALPDAMRASDEPLDAWLDDWEALVGARQDYAENLLDGERGVFTMPRDDDGDEIWMRMDFAGYCEVPESLLFPYPGGVSDA